MPEAVAVDELTAADDIYRLLRALELTHSLVTLRFAEGGKDYLSLILGADLDQRTLLLDELQPEDGNDRLRRGEPCLLVARHQGAGIHGRLQQPQWLPDTGFQFPFPAALQYRQRRRRFRVVLRQQPEATLTLPRGKSPTPSAQPIQREDQVQHQGEQTAQTDNATALRGQLLDLSGDGCAAAFSQPPEPALLHQQHVPGARLSIPGLLDVTLTVEAREPRFDPLSGHYRSGFAFVHPDAATQRHLERAVLDLQRQQRR